MFPVTLPFPQHMYSAEKRINHASLTDLRATLWSRTSPPLFNPRVRFMNLSWFRGDNNLTSYMVVRVLSYEF